MKKVLIGLLVLLLILIGSVLIFPLFFKGKLNALIKSEANKRLNASINYADFDLSLLRSFPDMEFHLKGLSITGLGVFQGDTLLGVEDFVLRLDLKSVISGNQLQIKGIRIADAQLNAVVAKSGKASWDILKPGPAAEPEESRPYRLQLSRYEIQKFRLLYADSLSGTSFSMKEFNFSGSGDIAEALYDFDFESSGSGINLKNGGLSWLNQASFDTKMKLKADNAQKKYSLAENVFRLNDFSLKSEGFVRLLNDSVYEMDLKLSSENNRFKSLLSLVPAIFQKDFASVKADGILSFSAALKGKMEGTDYPSLDVKIKTTDASFRYPSLPVGVNNISFVAQISKPQGPLDRMMVDVSSFHAEALQDKLDASLKLRNPLSDPDLNLKLNANLNLANVARYYPLDQAQNLSGKLLADIAFAGRMSDVSEKRYEKVNASGQLSVSDMVYKSSELPMPVKVQSLQLALNPSRAELKNLQAELGNSDLKASGSLENFIPYAFGKGELGGDLSISGQRLNLNELMGSASAEKKQDTVKGSYTKVPGAVNFTAKASFAEILYDRMILKNMKGSVELRNETLQLKGIQADLLGGSALINGRYSTPEGGMPLIDFDYDIRSFDFQQTMQQVEMSAKIAPVLAYLEGNFSSNLSLSGKLNEDLGVDYSSLSGQGKVNIHKARLNKTLPALDKIAELARVPALRDLEIKDAWTILKFKDGKVETEPAEFKAGPVTIGLQGYKGFDQNIDYNLRFDLPAAMAGGAAQSLLSRIPQIPGVPIKMPEKFSLFFSVKGPMQKPQVKLSKVTTGGSSSVKESLNAALDAQKQRALEEVKALEQKAREEAERQKRELETKAKAEAERLKAEAEKKAKEAAEKAKKEAANQLKNALKWPK